MTSEIKDLAPVILEAIKSSKKILLHCHPYPDPDSVGSVLAMASAMKKMSKDVTAIVGDSKYPEYLEALPNRDWIGSKNYSQVEPEQFDLFIILDSSAPNQISQLAEVTFPRGMKTIVIDHHITNSKFGQINLVDPSSSSTSEILYKLFALWSIEVDSNIALYLFLGIFADTGGFKYQNTSPETLRIGSELAKIYPNYHKFVFDFENSKKPIEIEMMGLALSSIEKYFSDNVVFSVIPYEEIKKRNLSKEEAMEGLIPNTLRSVTGWDLVASIVEAEPNMVTISLRTRDQEKYDVSKIAKLIGKGGGHPGAAGTTVSESLDTAKQMLLDEIAKLFPDLGSK